MDHRVVLTAAGEALSLTLPSLDSGEIDILQDVFVMNEEITELIGDPSSESKTDEEEIQMEDVKDMDTGAEVEVDDATENKMYDSVEVKECVNCELK